MRARTAAPDGASHDSITEGAPLAALTPEVLLRAFAVEARVESVVGVHLERFAWREKPAISWVAGDPEGTGRDRAGGSN